MPNRILRDWTASEKIDHLSPGAEVFFTRLIMKADDYGLYYGNPKLLNSALFPLREYTNSQVLKWLNECVGCGVIQKYTVDEKEYIHILGFDQRLRLMKSKFPAPPKLAELHEPSNDGQMTDIRPPETKRNETETETKVVPFQGLVLKAWDEWIQYQKEKKRKLTPTTVKKQVQFLGGRGDPEIIQIINNSITNGWVGLFELKKGNNGTTNNRGNTQGTIRRADAVIEEGKDFGDFQQH
jgi:hypothetical protein